MLLEESSPRIIGDKRKTSRSKLSLPKELPELPTTPEEYREHMKRFEAMNESDRLNLFWILARMDLYFLLRYVLMIGKEVNKKTGEFVWENPFTMARCREVQAWSHDVLDIWSRGHGKSRIKTIALSIQDLLLDSEEMIGIFSHNRHSAKAFARVIKAELEQNELLKLLSWDPERQVRTFWDNPKKDVSPWSIDEGLVINRRHESNTASVEAWGLVDSHPTGKHFTILTYDDLVTKESVATPGQIDKVNDAWEESLNLCVPDSSTFRYTGTFWAYGDSYHHLIDRGITPRFHPCYELVDIEYVGDTKKPLMVHVDRDKPVAYSKDWLEKMEKQMGPRVFAAQCLCNPQDALVTGFSREDLRYYEGSAHEEAKGKNLYILIDPANEKRKGSDFTVMFVVAVGSDHNLYVVDGLRDRLNLKERCAELFRLHRAWSRISGKPPEVRIERYGLMADGQHYKYVMEVEKYRFHLVELTDMTPKDDRIARLQPLFADHRIYLPTELKRVRMSDGKTYDLVREFEEDEFLPWPHAKTRDMLDCLARISQPEHPLHYPSGKDDGPKTGTRREFMARHGDRQPLGGWMSW